MTRSHDDRCVSVQAGAVRPPVPKCLRWRDCVWPAGKVVAMALSALLLLLQIVAYVAVIAARAVARSTRGRPK